MKEWQYDPAADLNATLRERLRGFPREPHIWMYVLRSLTALIIRLWLKLYHRFEIHGADRLPIGRAFILVANHQSHLDTLGLTAAIPARFLHRTFPAAAADYFFKSVPRSIFSATVINGLPFDRDTKGAESLGVCRELLNNQGNILIIFPEGTRSATGELGRFRSGIGRLTVGTDIPIVPCYLEGAFEALPKGASFPRPYKLRLLIGEPQQYSELPPGKQSVEYICSDLEKSVAALAAAKQSG